MREALKLAETAAAWGEIPVGAVVVNKSGEIIGSGFNTRETDKNPLGHAEIAAIAQAAVTIGDWRLCGCSLYVTLEPCPMCAGAIINSRIERVYFGAFDKNNGAVCSVEEMFLNAYTFKPEYYCGIMEEECSALLTAFFGKLR